MSSHLSEDQISRSFLGRSTMEEHEHLQNCAQCRAEMERFRAMCSLFRTAMKDLTDRLVASGVSPTIAAEERTIRPRAFYWQWALVGVAAILLTVIPLYESYYSLRHQTETKHAATQSIDSASESATSGDVLLMEAVMAHRARALPAPMEPVMILLPSDALGRESDEPKTRQRSLLPGEIR